MKLKKAAEIVVEPAAPFDFDSTFHKPDHFTTGDNAWQPGTRWQTWQCQSQQLGLRFQNEGTIDQPKLLVWVYTAENLSESTINGLIAEVNYRYNLQLDLSEFYRVLGDDEILGPILRRWRGMRPGHPSSLYEYLIIGIVLQNAAVRRSIQMFKALLEHYGTLLEYDGRELWCFWAPGGLEGVTEEELRGLKVGYRAKSIQRIDAYFAQGRIDEIELRKADRETVVMELLKLYGVGPATAGYLMFDVFHYWDFFNHISPWEQKIYTKLFFDQNPETPAPVETLLQYFERFGVYKQLAVHYIWEDLWWKRKNETIPWLEKLIRV